MRLAEHVGTGHAEVGSTGLDIHRHVSRLHHQEIDRLIARGYQKLATRVGRELHTRPPKPRHRRLEQPTLGQGYPQPSQTGASAIVSRSSDTPTAGIGRPNRAIRSVVASAGSRRAARSCDVELEVDAGVVIESADFAEVVHDVRPFARA